MTDHIIIGSFIKKVYKQLFSKTLMKMIILKGKKSCIKGRYKSKRLMIFL